MLAQEGEGEGIFSELIPLLPLVLLLAKGAADKRVGVDDIALGGVAITHDNGCRSSEDTSTASLLHEVEFTPREGDRP